MNTNRKNMKKIRISLIAIVILLGYTAVHAQSKELQMNINYSLGFPMGSFKDVIQKNSYRGWQGSILYGINDKISVGLGSGFQDFYQKNERQVYKSSDGSDISAVLTHSIQTIPILLQGKYNFSPQAAIQPYAALGVGGNMVMYRELLGEFGGTKTSFGFAARPEAGVFIPLSKSRETGLNLGASFNYMPFNKNNIASLNSIGVSAGIKFPLRK